MHSVAILAQDILTQAGTLVVPGLRLPTVILSECSRMSGNSFGVFGSLNDELRRHIIGFVVRSAGAGAPPLRLLAQASKDFKSCPNENLGDLGKLTDADDLEVWEVWETIWQFAAGDDHALRGGFQWSRGCQCRQELALATTIKQLFDIHWGFVQ